MKVICKICCGTGKVSKDFGMGKCKEIPDDYNHRVCPGCDGTGMQEEPQSIQQRPIIFPSPSPIPHPCKPRPSPFDIPPPVPYPFDPWRPYKDPKKRRRKMFPPIYPQWSHSYTCRSEEQ